MTYRKIALLAIFMLASLIIVAGCASSSVKLEEGKVNVITSFYPLYYFADKIGGEQVQVINLVPTGVDPHDWAPKPQELANLMNADVFIYNGLGLEGWAESFVDSLKQDHPLVTVMASEGVKVITNGSSAHSHEHEHGHEDEYEQEHVDEHRQDDHAHNHGGMDPHVWLSPLQAMSMAENIKNGLIQASPDDAALFEKNFALLMDELEELHEQYTEMTRQARTHDLVVSHEAFGYLARDYRLNQVGVMGLSSYAEPSVQTMRRITDFIQEHDIQYILFEELASPKIAQTLARDNGIDVLMINTLEGLTSEQVEAGEDYMSIMYKNLTTLRKALE